MTAPFQVRQDPETGQLAVRVGRGRLAWTVFEQGPDGLREVCWKSDLQVADWPLQPQHSGFGI